MGIGHVTGGGEIGPIGGRLDAPFALLAKDEAGFLPQLADRGGGERVGAIVLAILKQAVAADLWHAPGERHARVGRIDRPAGKDELVGHEGRARAALAHQHLGSAIRSRSTITVAALRTAVLSAFCGVV